MNIIGWIVIGFIILVLAVVYFLFMFAYLGWRATYKETVKANAVITGVSDMTKYAAGTGGRGGLSQNYEKARKYTVSFYLNDVKVVKEVELKKADLTVGNQVEVRYVCRDNGEIDMFDEGMYRWLKHMALGWTGGLILSIVFIVLYCMGILSL